MEKIKLIDKLNILGIFNNKGINPKYKTILSNQDNLLQEIIAATSFISTESDNLRERLYCIKHNITSSVKCSNTHCNNTVKFNLTGRYRNTYTKFCSLKCANTCEATKNKKEQTYLERYGVSNPSQAESIKDKKIQTSNKKYNVDYPWQLPSIQQKKIKTVQERYGVTNIAQTHLPIKTLSLLQNKEWLMEQHHLKRIPLSTIAKELDVDFDVVKRRLEWFEIEQKYWTNPTNTRISRCQQEIAVWIKSLGVNVIQNSKPIYPLELDIYLPEYNMAIEYNGLFWHSDYHARIGPNYHLQKTVMCEQKGIRLIHIFEDEWRDQQQKCKDTIRHLLGKSPKGTYARDSYIKEISWNQARDFLNNHHLLGAGSSGNYRIGAFDKHTDELIGVMVFGRSTSERSNEIELKRFVTNKRNNPGLGSKMFKFATKHQKYSEVIAFVDRRWFTGLVKDHIGFERIYETKPAVWWTDGVNRYHRRFMTKQQALTLLPENYSILSKHQALNQLGFYRTWDCGKIKLKWTSPI